MTAAWRALWLALLLGLAACAARAATLHLPVVEVLDLQEIEVPEHVDTLIIDQVRVVGPGRNAARLTVFRPKSASGGPGRSPSWAPGLRDEPRAQRVDVRINAVVATARRAPPLEIMFRDLELQDLTIRRDGRTDELVVDLSMDQATLRGADLNGGRYRDIDLKVGSLEYATQAFNISVIVDQIHDLQIVGEGPNSVVAIRTSAALGRSEAGRNAPGVLISNLQATSAELAFERADPDNELSAKPSCTERGPVTLQELWVGTPKRLLTSDQWKPGAIKIALPRTMCFALELTDIEINGRMEITAGTLEELTISSVESQPDDRGLSVDAGRLKRIQVKSATLSNLLLSEASPDGAPDLELLAWSNVETHRMVILPERLFDKLRETLARAPRDPALVGIRDFLVASRWHGYTSGDEPARYAKPSLQAVLENDARSIYGGFGATFLLVLTGFGVTPWWPMATCAVLLLAPIPLVWGATRSWQFVGEYYRALVTGDAPAGWARYAVPLHRLIIAIVIGLITLFVQNAVLVGA